MKRFAYLTAAFAILFIMCSCTGKEIAKSTESTSTTPEISPAVIDITLKADEHAELDLDDQEGEQMVKDFAIDGEKIYFLQQNGIVLTYDYQGNFEERYDLKLSEQGLTASRITCGNGKLYLIDGHNNAIITAEKDKVENVSLLNSTDVGMMKNFYATKNNTVMMSFADLDEAYTVEIDPSEAETKIIGEKQRGYLIDENTMYLPEVVDSELGTSQVKVTVCSAGKTIDEFYISSPEQTRSVVGLSIYGISDGNWFGLLHEFVNKSDDSDGEQYHITSVSINTKDGVIETSPSSLDGNEMIALTENETYCMTISNNTLTIKPISEYFSDWTESDIYALSR